MDNIELVKHLYDAFSKGDIQTILSNVTDNIEWRTDGPSIIPTAGTTHGREGVIGFFQLLAGAEEHPQLTIDDYCGAGGKVIALGQYRSIVKATGKPIDTAVAHIFTIENGRVKRFHAFADTAQMAEAYKG